MYDFQPKACAVVVSQPQYKTKIIKHDSFNTESSDHLVVYVVLVHIVLEKYQKGLKMNKSKYILSYHM